MKEPKHITIEAIYEPDMALMVKALQIVKSIQPDSKGQDEQQDQQKGA